MAAGARAGRVWWAATTWRKPGCADDYRDADSHASATDGDGSPERHAGAANGDRNGDRECHGKYNAGHDAERHVDTLAVASGNRNHHANRYSGTNRRTALPCADANPGSADRGAAD